MTTSALSELLQKKAESYEAESQKNREIIDDWLAAISKLFGDLKGWLAVSDPTHILQIVDGNTEVHEPNLGRYVAPRLDIRAFGIWVGVIPKARKTVGTARPPQVGAPERATGRIDITNEIRRYVLYRLTNNGNDSWYIESPSSNEPKPLTQERFEEALMSYFQ